MAGEGFLEELDIARRSNHSNVFLIECRDPERERQVVRNFHPDAERYFFSLQTQELRDEKANLVRVDSLNPYNTIRSLLAQKPATVFMSFAWREENALVEFLLSIARKAELFELKSSCVVFCENLEIFPQALRRISFTISVPVASEAERRAILQRVAKGVAKAKHRKKPYSIERRAIAESRGLSLFETETVALRSIYQHGKIAAQAFTEFKIRKLREHGLEYIQPTRGFGSVGGYDYLKDYFSERVIAVLENQKLAEEYGIKPPRGLLFYGAPGTGKTYFAKALAKELGLPMISLNMGDFLRGIVGQSERRVREVTQLIESLSPVVVFIDEFDQVALARGSYASGDSGVTRRVQNQLLEWLGDEQRRSIIIGASNFLTDLDRAFIRVGRMDEVVPFYYPDEGARAEIFRVHVEVLRSPPREIGREDYLELAGMTEYFNCAELSKVVEDACYLAFRAREKLSFSHFERVLENFSIPREQREQEELAMNRQLKELNITTRSLLR